MEMMPAHLPIHYKIRLEMLPGGTSLMLDRSITGLAAGTYTITTLSQSPDCAVTKTLLSRVKCSLDILKHIPKSRVLQ
jgi:hypothetical protein